MAVAQLRIQAVYEQTVLVGYAVADEGKRVFFKRDKKADAVAYGREIVDRAIRKKADLSGITDPLIETTVEDKMITGTGLIVEVVITATAK
jgi:hypothetical protein